MHLSTVTCVMLMCVVSFGEVPSDGKTTVTGDRVHAIFSIY